MPKIIDDAPHEPTVRPLVSAHDQTNEHAPDHANNHAHEHANDQTNDHAPDHANEHDERAEPLRRQGRGASAIEVEELWGRRLAIDASTLVCGHERAASLVMERTLRLEAEAALAQLDGLQKVTAAFSEAATWEQIAHVVVTEMASALGAAHALLGVSRDVDLGAELRLLGRSVDGLRAVEEHGVCLVTADQPIARAFRLGVPEWSTSPGVDDPGALLLEPASMGANVALPLRMLGKTLGAVALAYSSARCFTPADRALHESMARQASLALDRVGLFEAMQEGREWSEQLSRLLAERLQTVETLRQQKTDLMAFLAHDFKNPLCCVGPCVRHMLRNPDLADSDRIALRDVEVAADQVQRMALDLVDISRSEEGKLLLRRRTVDVQDLVQELVGWAEPQACERHQSISWWTDGGDARVEADQELLRRVLANLLDNALKYVPRLGRICVEVRLASPVAVEVRISDDGPGIPMAEHEHIFDKFIRLERDGARIPRSSRGLGLAFCRIAVEAHGGSIWAEDVEPRGVAFCLRLPRTSGVTVGVGAASGGVLDPAEHEWRRDGQPSSPASTR